MRQKMIRSACCFLILLVIIPFIGCGEKIKGKDELVIGNWMLYRSRAYIILVMRPEGSWTSTVRIADATSRIVKAKGEAKGSWHFEDDQLIFT
ncbi:MAG: flagellar basal body-associated protein FliL, partial [Desulfobacteraceae bacterium]|nr:flagellar basal body-associated protein FliL [Desulfobacteraceae bacterium]